MMRFGEIGAFDDNLASGGSHRVRSNPSQGVSGHGADGRASPSRSVSRPSGDRKFGPFLKPACRAQHEGPSFDALRPEAIG